MKKTFISLIVLALSLGIRIGTASTPDNTAAFEVHQAHSELMITDDILVDAFGLVEHQPEIIPCQGRISSGYGMRRWGRRRKMHKGIDIAAPIGTEVKAPAKGIVAFVGRKGAYGKTVVIDHGGETRTLFGHNSKILVKKGDSVEKGQVISLVGSTGRSTGPHLHYEVLIDGTAVNPSKYI